jgi:hypothetical protein
MTDLSKLVYRIHRQELRLEELTADGAALARLDLSPEERLVLQRWAESGQTARLIPIAGGGW